MLRDHTTLIRERSRPRGAPDRTGSRARHARQIRPERIKGGNGSPHPFGAPSSPISPWPGQLRRKRWAMNPPELEAAAWAIAGVRIPGRAELIPASPGDLRRRPRPRRRPALFKLLPELTDGREVACCSLCSEKDASGSCGRSRPRSPLRLHRDPAETMEGSGRPGGRSHPAGELADLCREAGVEAEAVRDPIVAWRRARGLAASAIGSRSQPVATTFSLHIDREARGELLTMIGLVAIVVAVAVLVFFAVGYAFGLLFLCGAPFHPRKRTTYTRGFHSPCSSRSRNRRRGTRPRHRPAGPLPGHRLPRVDLLDLLDARGGWRSRC